MQLRLAARMKAKTKKVGGSGRAVIRSFTHSRLAGAFYGVDGIPSGWLAKLAMREFITEMADSLLALSEIAPGVAT
jgi:hypothetical protein